MLNALPDTGFRVVLSGHAAVFLWGLLFSFRPLEFKRCDHEGEVRSASATP